MLVPVTGHISGTIPTFKAVLRHILSSEAIPVGITGIVYVDMHRPMEHQTMHTTDPAIRQGFAVRIWIRRYHPPPPPLSLDDEPVSLLDDDELSDDGEDVSLLLEDD